MGTVGLDSGLRDKLSVDNSRADRYAMDATYLEEMTDSTRRSIVKLDALCRWRTQRPQTQLELAVEEGGVQT